jgi:alcohol dehydrogenase
MMTFPFRLPGVNYYGKGAIANLKVEVAKSGVKQVLLISDYGVQKAGLVEKIQAMIEETGASVQLFLDVEAEPSFENIEAALAAFKACNGELVVGLGGGSSLDIAKAVSVMANNSGSMLDYVGIGLIPRAGVPGILIPTTAGTGSEVTQNAIFTDKKENLKKGVVSEYLLPAVAIVDSQLTLSMPPKVTAATGMDALTHAIESYTSNKTTLQTDLYALEAIRLVGKHLRRAVANGNDEDAREGMALASVFAGISLANAGVGAVHALAYPLGGQLGVAHGVANALLLPYVMEFNIVGHMDKFITVAEALGEHTAGLSRREAAFLAYKAVKELSQDVGIPQTMSEIGVKEEQIESLAIAAANVARLMANNPRVMTLDDVRAVYRKAL